jgi:hypothetical protein
MSAIRADCSKPSLSTGEAFVLASEPPLAVHGDAGYLDDETATWQRRRFARAGRYGD